MKDGRAESNCWWRSWLLRGYGGTCEGGGGLEGGVQGKKVGRDGGVLRLERSATWQTTALGARPTLAQPVRVETAIQYY